MEGLVATHGRLTLVIVGLIALVALTSAPIRASGPPVLPNPSQWPSHSSIRINADSDFTPANGVIGGDGTAGNPYEIA
ncbi:MAG TPA: hypothetical protein VNA10_05120, partial [Thermoplasmata archaeon]|nr:hypothetical protein [Thermoplasmata archaeon]